MGVGVAIHGLAMSTTIDLAKITFWRREINSILEAEGTTTRPLSKLLGRLSSGCWAVWRPAVAGRLTSLFQFFRSARAGGPEIMQALVWRGGLLRNCPARTRTYALTATDRTPCVVYTDGLGACLFREGHHEW